TPVRPWRRARRGRKGQDLFLRPHLHLPDGVLDGRVPAGEPVLVLEPLPDPAGRVPLLLRGLRVVVQDLTDDGEDRLDGRPPGRGQPAIPRGVPLGPELLRRP